jgi:hypothetical protein
MKLLYTILSYSLASANIAATRTRILREDSLKEMADASLEHSKLVIYLG